MTSVVNRVELPPLAVAPADKEQVLGPRLDLVEHVKVQLTVVVGSAEMPVGRLFALTPGEIVTLDSEVDQPIELRLRDRTVARGHLVAVGDKFGIRISEIST